MTKGRDVTTKGGSDGDDDRVVARNTVSISEILSTTVTCMYENSVQYSKYFKGCNTSGISRQYGMVTCMF